MPDCRLAAVAFGRGLDSEKRMSIGIDQDFQKLARQSEDELYRESKVAPILIREDRRDEVLRRIPREKLMRIAFEALFFLAALVLAVAIGYLLMLALADRIQANNTGIDIGELNGNNWSQNVVQVKDQFFTHRLLWAIFTLCSLVGIYLARVVLWAIGTLTKDTEPV